MERSADGIHFKSVGTLPGAGNSQLYQRYELKDDSPLSGTSYYRLKQTDFNGEFTYSDWVVVHLNETYTLNIYPNPSSGIFRVVTAHDGVFEIISATGQKLDEQKIVQGMNEINLTHRPNGIYFGRIIGIGETSFLKLVIDRK